MNPTRRRILACAPAIILTPGVLMPVRVTARHIRFVRYEPVALDAYGTWGVLYGVRAVERRVTLNEAWMSAS